MGTLTAGHIDRAAPSTSPNLTPCGSLASTSSARRCSAVRRMAAASRSNSLIHLNKGRNSLDPMVHSRDQRNRGKVSHSALPKAALDSTPAATRSRGDRIAIEDHTLGVPEKRHTELRAAAVATDRNQMAGRRRLLGSRAAGHKRKSADRRLVAGHTRQTECSRVAGRRSAADRRLVAGHTR